MPSDETSSARGSSANPGYAAFQLARALATSAHHDDEATRERAREKTRRWADVLEGMLSGRLAIGSRQPLPSIPVWATTEVLTGGFATGKLIAGGPLIPREIELAARITPDRAPSDRRALNGHFLTEAGLAELAALLRSGCYDIQVPEEGALLVMAWLVEHGHADDARVLVNELAPHFSALRFYPVPADHPADFGPRIFLESTGEVRDRVRGAVPNPRILAEREAIQVWAPLHDEMIRLFLETVEGEPPAIQPDAAGRWASLETRRFHIVGGWPCRRYAVDWPAQARQLAVEIDHALAKHTLCTKPRRKNGSFARLQEWLRKCADDPASLSGRDVGAIRLLMARHLTARGAPDSTKRRDLRDRQHAQAAGPMHHQFANVVQARLATAPPDGALDDMESALQSVTADEAVWAKVLPGAAIPPSIRRKVLRCLRETAGVLVARGVITSSETLARIIPQFTAGLRSQAFGDPALRALEAAIYRAFRRRRSVLLLDLESQVRIEEMPWVAAVERFRRRDVSARDLSRQTLKELAALTLRSFPHAILPNKLLQEFHALAKGGELDLPLVEELAADIFMDDFSPKFTRAAQRAAAWAEGTLYARYYGIDAMTIQRLASAQPESRWTSWLRGEAAVNPFARLCIERARVTESKHRDVARNGMVIEQSQILTTHNLAVLFQALDLAAELRPDLRGMAERCFRWICRRLQAKGGEWHARLIALKNSAYAWRQMIFYLAHFPAAEITSFLAWTTEHMGRQPTSFQQRLAPALRGLAHVHAGDSLADARDAQSFLGWSQERHWLLGEDSSNSPR